MSASTAAGAAARAAAAAAAAAGAAAAAAASEKKLGKIKVVPPPIWQQKCLVAWLDEWKIEQSFQAQDSRVKKSLNQPTSQENRKAHSHIPADLVRPYDRQPLAVGQIRLLSPRALPDVDRPVYVAVLRKAKSNYCLVAPFSLFTVPAVPSELMTGREEPFLRVLSLWNCQTTTAEIVGTSWIFDDLGRQLLADAWAVYQRFTAKLPLPKRLTQRVGPPLSHPLDPRYEYLEAADLDSAFQSAKAAEP